MMRKFGLGGAKSLYFIIIFIFFLPHYIFYLCSKSKQIIKIDVERWTTCLSRSQHGNFIDLLYLLMYVKEFRNVFYLRIGSLSFFLRYIRPLSSLYIATKNENFGAGTFIQHGFSTVIAAECVGKNCWINQQVTIGYNNSNKYGYGKPVIGNNVRVSAGAKVCGKITVGDNSIIGMNAVVVKNVPSFSVVIPSPTMMIVDNNEKTYKRL